MIDDPVAAMADVVSAGVAEMADAVTAVLAQIDAAGQAVVTALNAAVAGTEKAYGGAGAGEAASPAPTNWAAYSHQELYRMVQEQSDVGEVSEIAAEWGRHAEALTGHTDALREQRVALTAHWQGALAERAAARIDQLAELVGAIGARAGRVRQAAQESADALALARNTMPPPPGQPALGATSDGTDTGSTPTGTAGGAAEPGVVFAVGAVFVGGTSMFDANFFSGSAKARAEEVMRGYESSLHGSDALIAPPVTAAAGGTDLGGSTRTAGFTSGAAGPGVPGGGGGGGVPWSQLTSGGGAPDHGGAPGRGSLPPGAGGPALRAAINQLRASGRGPGGAGGVGFSPFLAPMTRSDDDKVHKRRQPDVVKGLFDDDRIPSKPVIGE
ncbi:hypothetical protein [Saccharothrix sp. NRRL B-16314]|uniref:hypothetical protein n=1 Tax=Saccharothrix sp. NRRL B-16314 TaxID=1463825 RepID=UPI000526560F|nr:hypothetical protein [Saccharothrix sp. NRRL B-16314]